MSLVPDPKPGDWFRMRWDSLRKTVPTDLVGRVVNSVEALEALLPSSKEWGPVRIVESVAARGIGKGYTVYGRSVEEDSYQFVVGYQCNNCNKIILDMPKVIDEQSISELAGREGYDVDCAECNSNLDEHTFVLS